MTTIPGQGKCTPLLSLDAVFGRTRTQAVRRYSYSCPMAQLSGMQSSEYEYHVVEYEYEMII